MTEFPLPRAGVALPRRVATVPRAGARLLTPTAALPGRAPDPAAAVAIELPPPAALVTIPNVELLVAGTWMTSTGEFTWDPAHLTAAVAAADDPGFQTPVIKIGHEQPTWMGGEPAVGIIKNLRVNGNSTILSGDLVGVPGWLGAVLPYAWPDRSIEGFFDWNTGGAVEHPFVLTALALLGVLAGAVSRLADVPLLWAESGLPGTTVNGKPLAELLP